MPLTFDGFVRSLTDHGLLDADDLRDWLAHLPAGQRPRTAEDLARELVRAGKLTKFQAQIVYHGKAKGLVMGNYVILDKLGEGGMGQVFQARHKRMDRRVALKILPAAATKSADAVKRFQREMRAAARLSHPNIVTAHDADEERGVHFLAMEYVDGSDLGRVVKEQGALPLAQALDYVRQAALGLQYAHEQGIVHRDIKPSNLLVDSRGTVKILDLGLARLADHTGGSDDGLTRSGQVMGTLDYMAPEQALDTKRADARADIYSLGCTLYYLLTGQVVYPEDTLTKKIFAHAQQPIPDLQTLCPEVPEAVATLCRRMLAKKPEDRPQSMAEVLTALSACPVTAGLAGRPDRSAPEDRPAPLAAPTGETANLRRADVETSRESHPATSFSPTLMREPVPLPWLRARQRPLFPSWFGSPLDRRWRIGLSVAVGTMSLLLLVWAVIMLRTKAGTLVVELSDPDVVVQVFSAEGRLEIERPGAREPLTISIVPGPYQLRIKQDDLVVFAQEFTLASGSRQLIQARWEAAPIVATPTTAVPESAPVPETPAASQLPQQAVTTAATPALAPAPAPAIVATDAGRPAPATNPFDAAKAAELQAAWAMYLTTPVTITNSIGMRMQLVPPGEFTMGSGTSERDRGTDEYAHQVRILQPYFAGIFEVTQDEYERVMRDKPSWFAATGGGATQVAGRDTSRFPVEMVSWNDATEFCRQLSGLPEERAAGRTYRLPTEAEWEFACRAGTESAFHFGLQPAHHGANIGFRSNRTNGVGGAAANAFGLHDMHGNVWEWCQDWYKGDYYQTSPRDDPQGPTQGTTRVRRGGSWDCFTGLCRSAYRGGSSPTSRVSNLGFRVVFTAGP